MKKQILALPLSLALGAAAAPASAAELCKAISGPVSGPWYASMGQMAKAVNTVYPDIKFEMLPGGALANPMRMQSKDGDISLVTNCIGFAAREGADPYKKPVSGVNSLFSIGDTARFTIMIRSDLGINSIEDIAAKKPALRVAYGPKSAATWVGGWVFERYGFNYKDIESWGGKLYSNNYDDVVNMARDGQIDCVIWLGPGEGWFITEIVKNVPMKFLPVSKEIAESMTADKGLVPGFVPKDYYAGYVGDSDVPTVRAVTEVIVRDDLSEDMAYKITKVICEHKDDLAQGNAMWSTFTPETAWQNLSYPIHPGAMKYYKEQGWIK